MPAQVADPGAGRRWNELTLAGALIAQGLTMDRGLRLAGAAVRDSCLAVA